MTWFPIASSPCWLSSGGHNPASKSLLKFSTWSWTSYSRSGCSHNSLIDEINKWINLFKNLYILKSLFSTYTLQVFWKCSGSKDLFYIFSKMIKYLWKKLRKVQELLKGIWGCYHRIQNKTNKSTHAYKEKDTIL